MADTVTGPTILQQNDKRVVIKIVNQSDGSGGTTVFADVSALAANKNGQSVTTVSPQRIWWSCANGDGVLFTVWLFILYYGKVWIDTRFKQKECTCLRR
jgi:hypothetical protein